MIVSPRSGALVRIEDGQLFFENWDIDFQNAVVNEDSWRKCQEEILLWLLRTQIKHGGTVQNSSVTTLVALDCGPGLKMNA